MKIINAKEFSTLVIVLVVTLLIGWLLTPQETLLESSSLWLSMVNHIPWSVLVAFGMGSVLWIGDYLFREKIISTNK